MKLLLVAALLLAGCECGKLCEQPPPMTAGEVNNKDHKSGLGMGYNGKLGVDLGGGLIMGFDGKLHVGFGF